MLNRLPHEEENFMWFRWTIYFRRDIVKGPSFHFYGYVCDKKLNFIQKLFDYWFYNLRFHLLNHVKNWFVVYL